MSRIIRPLEDRAWNDASVRALPDSRTVEGLAAVFNSFSEDMWGMREVVRRGAFAKTLADGADVRLLWNHNDDMPLARRSTGTLRLLESDSGLAIDADLAETSVGNDALVLIGNGTVSQMSFGFYVIRDRWTFSADESTPDIRELLEVKLIEVSPVSFPAYPATSVQMGKNNVDGLMESLKRAESRAMFMKDDFAIERAHARLENVLRKMTEPSTTPTTPLEPEAPDTHSLANMRRRLQLQERM